MDTAHASVEVSVFCATHTDFDGHDQNHLRPGEREQRECKHQQREEAWRGCIHTRSKMFHCGDLSGTPTEAGVCRFSYQAQDASNPPNQISGETEITVVQ
jgi:hypothetical protein